ANDGTSLGCLQHPAEVLSAAFSPDGRHIATACADSQARVWNVESHRTELILSGHTNVVRCAMYSHNGKWIATASQDHTARIWDVTDGHQIRAFYHPNWVQFVAFSPDDRTLLTGCDDHQARVWNLQTGEQISPTLLHRDVVSSGGISPDGRYIL